MLHKIIIMIMTMSILICGTAQASNLTAVKTMTLPETIVSIDLPEHFVTQTIEHPMRSDDELQVKVVELMAADEQKPELLLDIIVVKSKITEILPNLDYRPSGVMLGHFQEGLQARGWQNLTNNGSYKKDKMQFAIFQGYLLNSKGEKYFCEAYLTMQHGEEIHIIAMNKGKELMASEKGLLEQVTASLALKA